MKTRRFLVLLVMFQVVSAGSRCKKRTVHGKLKLDCTLIYHDDPMMMIPPYYADDGKTLSAADFSNNNILRLYEDTTFSQIGYNDVTELKFQRCNITQVFKANFEGLSILRVLVLSSNKLRSIEAGSFADLSRLEKLDLSDNILATLDPQTLIVLTNLRKLDLSKNSFKTLVIPGLIKAEKQNQTFWKMENENEISLSDNPWICNCELGPLHRDLRARGLLPGNVRCGDSLWTKMTPGNFSCPPSLSLVSPPQMVDIGDNLTLTCQFEGNPMPKPLWTTTAGEPIREGATRRISSLEERSDGYLGVVRIRLNFTIQTAADVGSVECRADNGVGKVKKIIKISQFKVQSDSSLGLIVGLSILGGFALMSLFIGLLVFLLWRKNFQKKTKDSSFAMLSRSSSVSTLPTFPTLPPMRRDQLDPSLINPLPKPPRLGASSSSRRSLALGPNDSHVLLTEQDELNCNYLTRGPGPHLMFSNQSFTANSSLSSQPALVSWLDNRPGSRASIVTLSSLVSSPPVLPSLVHSQTIPPSGQARPGYVTLPRKPKQRPPASTVDYLGPRTSGDGSSHTNINKVALSLTTMKFPPLSENNHQLEPPACLQEEGGGADTPLQRSLLDPIQE